MFKSLKLLLFCIALALGCQKESSSPDDTGTQEGVSAGNPNSGGKTSLVINPTSRETILIEGGDLDGSTLDPSSVTSTESFSLTLGVTQTNDGGVAVDVETDSFEGSLALRLPGSILNFMDPPETSFENVDATESALDGTNPQPASPTIDEGDAVLTVTESTLFTFNQKTEDQETDDELEEDPPAVPTKQRIFLSSTTSDGNLGGISGADSTCNSLASSAGLTGTWKALISDSTEDVASRITITLPVYNMNDELIANDGAGLWNANNVNLLAAPQYDENGTLVNVDPFAWMGSDWDGVNVGPYCSDWSSNSGNGNWGLASAVDATWAYFSDDPCTQLHHIYCIDGQ